FACALRRAARDAGLTLQTEAYADEEATPPPAEKKSRAGWWGAAAGLLLGIGALVLFEVTAGETAEPSEAGEVGALVGSASASES
ncbi:MAG TPA: hypothetical protein DEF51_29745, partial [Myxococcales bacterium]|nr:hypothetical protein [Myxococcales bacterium]